MEVNITMIGGPGTGKTCYLYAMADQMIFGLNGFSFQAADYNVACDLQDKWFMMAEEGKWPRNTDKNREIKFRCCYGTRELATFNWFDYRGGLCTEGNLDRSNPEVTEFIDVMDRSTCLLILISAEDIKGVLNGNTASVRLFQRYISLLNLYSEKHKPVPIAFTITKGDLLEEGEFERGVELLKNRYFSQFFINDSESGGWLITFVVVGLGAEKLGKTEDGMILGTISPFNVHLPVLFAIRCSYTKQIETIKQEKSRLSRERDGYVREYETVSKRSALSRWWHGDDLDEVTAELEDARNRVRKTEENFNKYYANLLKLTNELMESNTAIVYCNGEKMELDGV